MDGDPVVESPNVIPESSLSEPIQNGKETKRLLENGFACWADLYTGRQLRLLLKALAVVKTQDVDPLVKERLAFCIMGAAEMPAYLSRWDRFHLKAFESMANHRYTQTKFSVETNLMSPIGRGTLPRRFAAGISTRRWLIESCGTAPKVVSSINTQRVRKNTNWDILIATGSSTAQALRDASVSIVLTDPPYFDDVQYGELARLFHAWLKVYDPRVIVEECYEASPNAVRGTSASDYENIIAACLTESRRTLKNDGTLVLTFHNRKLAAWSALSGAICRSGFHVKALAVVRAENGADHCKRNVKAMLHDLVLECVPARDLAAPDVKLAFEPRTLPEWNLAAIGLALAECSKIGSARGLRLCYERNLSLWTKRKRLID